MNGSFCPESPTRRAADEVAPTSISGPTSISSKITSSRFSGVKGNTGKGLGIQGKTPQRVKPTGSPLQHEQRAAAHQCLQQRCPPDPPTPGANRAPGSGDSECGCGWHRCRLRAFKCVLDFLWILHLTSILVQSCHDFRTRCQSTV